MAHTRRLTALLVAVGLLAASGFAADGTADSQPRVSIVSDSVLTSVTLGNEAAQAALAEGLDVQIDAGVCRRLNGQSCEYSGGYVTTTLEVLDGWSSLGPVVVIVDGYNDIPSAFPADVELVLDALRARGVQHVLWVNLHAVRQEYVDKNAVLTAAAERHPELTVLDWNSYSSPHPEWYQSDFIHLVPAGGLAIASWLHDAIVAALAPPPTAPQLAATAEQVVVTRAGARVDRLLHAVGGVAPLRWQATGGALRRTRLHLLARGELRGRPVRPGVYRVQVQVGDATGATVQVALSVTIRRR